MVADGFDQFASFPLHTDLDEGLADNGMVDPADDDLSLYEETAEEELSFEQKVDKVGRCVTKHPLYREILYKTLKFCAEERVLADVECEIATYPEFAHCGQNQYALVTSLVKAGGLDYIERGEDGQVVLPEHKVGLTEDEAEDLVATWNYRTSEAGKAFLEEFDPAQRLSRQVDADVERKDVYLDVLRYVAEQPRSMDDIDKLLEGREIGTYVNGRYETVKPSVFVDKLERAGALVWDKSWKITKEGEAYLDGK